LLRQRARAVIRVGCWWALKQRADEAVQDVGANRRAGAAAMT
jgi:hypothetical protein